MAQNRFLWTFALWTVSGIPTLPALAPSLALAEDNQPVIESIEGDKIVVVKTPEGNRVAGPGTKINFGDRVKTGPHASCKIRYPDGSKLLIGRATEMEVLEAANGTQFNQLHDGEIRGIIKKPKALNQGAPPRFVVRTKSAVMGVRGTDFVYNLDAAATKSEIHTLDGIVEVAKDEAALMEGKGVPVRRDEMLTADAAQISAPQKFDRQTYVASLEEAQPEFVALTRHDPDVISHEMGQQPEDPAALEEPRVRLLSFQVNSIYVRQQSGGDAFSGEISWNPTVRVKGPFAVRGHLGAFLLKGKGDEKFTAFEMGALVSISALKPLLLELGGGAQTWGEHSGLGGVGMANVGWKLGENKILDRIFLGTSLYDRSVKAVAPGASTTRESVLQMKAGVGIQF